MTGVNSQRIGVLGVVAIGLFVALLARLAILQVAGEERAVAEAEVNRTRVLTEPAPRGVIKDRNGTVLVDNREARQVTVDQAELDEATDFDPEARVEVLTRLADELTRQGIFSTVDSIETAIEENVVDPLKPVPIAEDVSEEVEVVLLERHRDLPGIDVERVSLRVYPHGETAAHLLGYVGPVSQEQLDDLNDEGKEYYPNDLIGREGVELSYEDALRGRPGRRVFEVDATGRVTREVFDESTPAESGHDVWLNIDIGVQQVVERTLTDQIQALEGGVKGSAVVLDPSDGSVVAMASYPTYNPREFLNGISVKRYAQLTSNGSGQPLLNCVIFCQTSPGSTFKPVTAVMALRNGLVTPNEPYNDIGYYEVADCEGETCEFQNAGREPAGTVDLASSITVSSDSYYYRLGDLSWQRRGQIGEKPIQETAREFGFDAPTGIDLPGESPGIIHDPALRASLFEQYPDLYEHGDWLTGDSINLSIGQGDIEVTPLQIADAYMALANGGKLYEPRVGWRVVDVQEQGNDILVRTVEPTMTRQINLAPSWLSPIMRGLAGVPTEGLDGTAGEAFEGFDLAAFPVAGKTGTVEREGKGDSALFVGMGPMRPGSAPHCLMTVVIPEAGVFGGDAAAPVTRRVFDRLDPAADRCQLKPGRIDKAEPTDPAVTGEVP